MNKIYILSVTELSTLLNDGNIPRFGAVALVADARTPRTIARTNLAAAIISLDQSHFSHDPDPTLAGTCSQRVALLHEEYPNDAHHKYIHNVMQLV